MSKPKKAHSKLRISVTIIPSVNNMIDVLSKRLGVSKSAIVEKALKDLLEKQLSEDAKALSKMKFDDLPTEDEWLLIQSPLKPYDAD